MSWFEKIREKANSPFLRGGAIFVAGGIFTAVVSGIADYVNHDRDKLREAIKSFEDVAYQLEPLGTQYIEATLSQDAAEIEKNKSELLVNISSQVAAAKKLQPHVKNDSLVYDYMDSVIRLRDEIKADRAIEDMKPYWLAKSDVLSARDAIVEKHN